MRRVVPVRSEPGCANRGTTTPEQCSLTGQPHGQTSRPAAEVVLTVRTDMTEGQGLSWS